MVSALSMFKLCLSLQSACNCHHRAHQYIDGFFVYAVRFFFLNELNICLFTLIFFFFSFVPFLFLSLFHFIMYFNSLKKIECSFLFQEGKQKAYTFVQRNVLRWTEYDRFI